MAMDLNIETQIDQDIKRIELILSSDIFHIKNMDNPLFKSAFIETMICLRDLMAKSEKIANVRINFTDEITPSREVNDVTDLIKFTRDACCHVDSDNHINSGNGVVFSFNTIFGKGELFTAKSYFEDDICFCFGEHKIYLVRHIKRAFQESLQNLEPLMPRRKSLKEAEEMLKCTRKDLDK